MTSPRRVVYRALVGGYEDLREEEAARDSALPFICITDDPDLTSETWQIVHHEPRFSGDLTRSARALKILGHPVLDQFDETLWLDNTVALKQPPDALFESWLGDADVAAPLHSYRSTILGEAEAVIDAGLDDFARVYEQLHHYTSSHREVLEENPHWTGMLLRRRSAKTDAAMVAWWEDVLRFSRRDQLSFVPAMRSHSVRLRSVPVDSLSSQWHSWPRAVGRDAARQGSRLREALRPPVARIGELQQALEVTTSSLAITVAAREEVIASLRDERDLAREEAATAREEAARVREDLDRVRHERNLAHVDLVRNAAELTQMRRRVRRTKRRLRALRRETRAAPPRGVAAVVRRVLPRRT